MTAVRSRSWRSLAFVVALATLFALALPFMPQAQAQVTNDNTQDLQVSPEIDSNPTGTTHTLTASGLANNTEVDFEVESGPAVRVNCTNTGNTAQCPGGTANNDGNSPTTPDLTCNTGGGTTCSVFFTSDAQGQSVVRAWVDDDQNNTTFDGDASEGRYAGASDCIGGAGGQDDPSSLAGGCASGTAQPGDRTEVDDTDVVSKTWTQSVAAACIDAEPETDTNPSGSEHTITARATNSAAAPADATGTFDCAGTALPAGTVVDITVTDDTPDIYIKSVNGTATGGPTAGGPNSASGTTDANGQITVVIQCVSGAAANCTGTNTVNLAVQGAQSGAQASDSVDKTWQPAGNAAAFDATPETDVNEVGQTHVITCASRDAFGAGVAGTNCDAQVSAGPNSDNNIGTDGNTSNGYIGQCTTAADGTCTISYTSTETGTDTIQVFNDLNGNDVQNGGENTDGTTSDQITKEWVAAGLGSSDVDIDMENTAPGVANCDGLGDGTDDANDEKTATNAVNTTHEVCAERFGPDAVRDAGPITFSIVSGPGSLFLDANNDGVQNANEPSSTGPVTVQEGSCPTAGYNCVSITSTTAGTTVVRACLEGTTGVCDEGSKTWSGGAARNIDCTPGTATNPTGTTHSIECEVTDRFGNGVAASNVTFTLSGVGEYSTLDCFAGATCTRATDSTGNVTIRLTTADGEEGTSNLAAQIAADNGDSDTAFDLDDECDQPANEAPGGGTGDAPGAPAGNCETSVTKVWEDQDPTQCDDGVDNDGDGWVDFPDDPGCENAADDDEGNEPLVRDHSRTAEITRFKHIALPGKDKPALMVKGVVTVDDGFSACANQVPVKVQIRASGEWITRKTDSTNENGVFKVLIRHVHAKYRVVAPRIELPDEHGDIDRCLKAKDTAVYDH